MSADDFNMLWKAIDVIEAQEHLALSHIAIYPSLTKKARSERDKKQYAAAFPRDIYKKDAKDKSFLLSVLGGKRGR